MILIQIEEWIIFVVADVVGGVVVDSPRERKKRDWNDQQRGKKEKKKKKEEKEKWKERYWKELKEHFRHLFSPPNPISFFF